MLFRLRNVVLGNGANAATGGLMFGIFFVVSLYLQQVRGYPPLGAALRTMPLSLSLFVGSQITIRLFRRISPVTALAGGLLVQAAALTWWAAAIGPRSNILTSFVLPGMVWGFGMGAGIVAAFVVCTSGLHGAVQGAASGLVSTTLQVGGALGVAVLSTIADSRSGSLLVRNVARPEAMASGQAYALSAAVVLALVAVPLMLWLRTSWRPPAGHGHHAPADGPAVRANT